MNSEEQLLPDGQYDVIIIDSETLVESHQINDEAAQAGLSLVIVSGPYKGQVVSIDGVTIDQDPLFLLGSPATMRVTEGRLTVDLEP